MSGDAVTILAMIFGPIWNMFFSIMIPGTNLTPGEMAMFLLFTGVGLRFLKYLFTGAAETIFPADDSSSK